MAKQKDEIGKKEKGVPSSELKKSLYNKAIIEIRDRVKDVESVVPRMATVTSVLKNTLPHYFWCGFYFAEEEEMIIGPYQGSTACPNISYSGVCGTSAKKKKTVIVPDVHKFPGHIACDERSRSEIVVPLKDSQGRVIAVFDVDSTHVNAFDKIDQEYLEQIMPLLLEKEILR
ncbi:MAG: GAF domain-containing protein [Nanoarchaeota archaeon]|nr:GAF domain-containing protein [Nanoarchaeota archaeon]